MKLPDRIRKQLWTITVIGGALRLLLLLLPKSFLVTYRLPDDAMYYLTIARNLANGNGITFDGLQPTNGFHPLWLFVITPIYWVTSGAWDSVYAVMVLQSLLDTALIIACGYAAYRALGSHEQERHFAALTAALMYAFNPISIMRGINGLETTLAALLLTLWLIAYIDHWKSASSRYFRLAILSSLVFLARTDLVFLLVPALVALVIRDARKGVVMSSLLLPIMIGIAIVAPWLTWSYVTFGSIVQTSGEAVALFAKAKYDVIFADGGYSSFVISETLRTSIKPFVYSSFGIGAIALLIVLRRRSDRKQLSPYAPLILGVLALLAYHILSRGFIRDWYVIQLIALFTIISSIAFSQLADSRRLLLWLTLALFFCGWIWELTHPRLESQKVFTVMKPAEAGVVAGAFNSGYHGYLSSARVINLDGVVNNDILHYLRVKDLRRYIDSVGIDEIRDYRGTLGGYRNLFAPNLTEGFRLIDTLDAGNGEVLETWHRLE